MSALENLPPDQRAVLQLVLQRGRSYDEIAQVLSIDRSAVRQRALDAFDALTPATVLPGPEHALVTDYLLGQLPERVAEQVYSFLEASEADRAWAAAIVEAIGPLVSHPLPEIPAGGSDPASPADADGPGSSVLDRVRGALGTGVDAQSAPGGGAPAGPEHHDQSGEGDEGVQSDPDAESLLPPVATASWQESEDEFGSEGPREARPTSRRGGAILLGIVAVAIAAAIVIAVATSGGTGGGKPGTHQSAGGSQGTTTSTTATTGTGTTTTGTGTTTTGTGTTTTGTGTTTAGTGTTTTPGSATTPQILAQLNLSSPTGAGSTLGIAQVVRDAGVVGIVVDAQGVPPNTSHNAYAVWLYNSPSSHRFVGFVPTLVAKDGKLATEGRLPTDAASYHRLLITLETQSKPSSPGEVVLSGPFREQP